MATKGVKLGQKQQAKIKALIKSKGQSSEGKCTNCGNSKHIRDMCFKLYGYPDWWHELQVKKKKDITNRSGTTGRATIATVESQLSLFVSSKLPPQT